MVRLESIKWNKYVFGDWAGIVMTKLIKVDKQERERCLRR